MRHGAILCGTVNTPVFDLSLGDYLAELAMRVVEEGRVSPDLARSWGAPAQVGCRFAVLAPREGGSGGFLRLVEGSRVEGYRSLSTYGWAAFEMTVRDAFALHARIDRAAFRVLGAPKPVPGFANFIHFQVEGRAGEVLYLNTVLESRMAGLELPVAEAEVDSIFIAVLAAEDRAATLRFHVDALGFEEGESFTFPYSMINQSFGLAEDHATTLTMTKVGAMPAAEIDQYPQAARHRPLSPGELPPGNALLTFAHDDLDSVRAPFLEPPTRRDGPLYGGRRVATLVGPSEERIELVEC
ncbi:VOC family protein [Thermaurantiacus sp.]